MHIVIHPFFSIQTFCVPFRFANICRLAMKQHVEANKQQPAHVEARLHLNDFPRIYPLIGVPSRAPTPEAKNLRM